MRLSPILILLVGWPAVSAWTLQPTSATLHSTCQIHQVVFDGWKAEEIENDWVRLDLVPSLGGRLMQVSFNAHPYLFINPKTKGRYVSPGEANGRWINYGGDKVWPLPEGSQDEEHWVLQSSPLDDGPYEFQVITHGVRCTVQLNGPPDPPTGLQYTREISIGSDSPEITFHAVMKNVTSHPIRWAIQSVTQYDLASPVDPSQYNHRFWTFVPVRRHSAYLDGYHVVDGMSQDPSFKVTNGLFQLNWNYLQNEVWLDSSAGWVAIVDGVTRYAMVERSQYFRHESYPGKATLIFYKNGPSVTLDKDGYPHLSSSDPADSPYYMEVELNSPLATLPPGASYAMDTDWYPSRMDRKIATVTYAGIVGKAFAISIKPNGFYATGVFGVFFSGELQAYLYDNLGIHRTTITLRSVSPQDEINLNAPVVIPREIKRVDLHLVGSDGKDYGSLGDALVTTDRDN